jgi:HD-GYP domain-containing protein (c-di-GMP phosphodiesterase class II)
MRHMMRSSQKVREEGPLAPAPVPPQQAIVETPAVISPAPTAPPSTPPTQTPTVGPESAGEIATIEPPTATQSENPESIESTEATEPPDIEPVALIPDSEIYTSVVQAARHVFEQAETKSPVNAEMLTQAFTNVLRSFAKSDQLLTEAVRRRTNNTERSQRVANAALMAIRLGLEIDYDEKHCLGLGLCALMHDIGMLTIPDEVLDSPKLTTEQLQLLRNHPHESKGMVERFGANFAWIGQVVVQIHERHDGSGYPDQLRGDDIHEFARIIGLSDMYEALGHPRSDRKAHVIYSALTTIIDTRNKHFDPRLIKSLINIVSIFPLGSLVKLNNNTIGRVVGANKLYPTRPLVEIRLDHRGKKMNEPQLIYLEEEPMLYIVDPAIDESVLEEK